MGEAEMEEDIKELLDQDRIALEEVEPPEPGAPKPPPRKKKPGAGFWTRLTGTGKITPEDMAKARERAKRLSV
jgi:hypothetical protein